MFKEYQSKPITRKAYKVKTTDEIVIVGANTSAIQIGINMVTFKHYEPVESGDYIVYLNDDNIYHCNEETFLDRNIVP